MIRLLFWTIAASELSMGVLAWSWSKIRTYGPGFVVAGLTTLGVGYFKPDKPPVPPPVVPGEVQAALGEMIVLSAVSANPVQWICSPHCASKLDQHRNADGSLILVGRAEGVYRLAVCNASGGLVNQPAWVKVTIGKPSPGPGPNPGPTPPAPTPPTNTLLKKLQDCYAADSASPDLKAGQKSLLISLYSAMAAHAKDPSIKTTTDLRADMERVASEMINQSLLKTCREIIAAEVVSVLGDEPATLDDSMRAKAVAVFEQIASALRGVK